MSSNSDITSARRDGFRRGFAVLGVLAVAAGAIFGGDLFGVREAVLGRATPDPRPVAVSPFVSVGSRSTHTTTVLRSQPWWQGVRDLRGGSTATTASFKIDGGASQWRAKWTCKTGHLRAELSPATHPLLDAACPGSGTAYATRTGTQALAISAGGTWTLRIDQQVDVPLQEPPLPVMSAPGTVVVMAGSLHRIDQTGTGRVTVYRTAARKYVLRLGNLFVTPNIDLQIRLSPLSDPHSTHQYLSASSRFVAPLDVTAGSLNFSVPPGLDPTQYKSVVIWCPLVTSAYAAAALVSSR